MENNKKQSFVEVGGLRWSPELLSGTRGVVNPKNGISYFTQDDAVAEATEQELLVPTDEQYLQLCDRTAKKWIKRRWYDRWFHPDRQTGVLFTDLDNENTLFFPASGYRYYSNGSFNLVTTYGSYWSRSSSVYDATSGCSLRFYRGAVYPQYSNNCSNGFPVRCLVP